MLSFQPQLPGNRLYILTSSNNLRLSSQLSFSSLRSVDLQNNFGPSAQNKEPINTGLNISDYTAASNNHEQHSNKVRSSSHPSYSPVPHHTLAPTEMFCTAAWCTKKNERQQQFSWTCWNPNCSEIAAVSIKAQHQYPPSSPRSWCQLRTEISILTHPVNQERWKTAVH